MLKLTTNTAPHCRVVNPIGSTDIDCIDKINKPSPCLNKRSVFCRNIFSLNKYHEGSSPLNISFLNLNVKKLCKL